MKKIFLIVGASGLLGSAWLKKNLNRYIFFVNINRRPIKNNKIKKITLDLKNKKKIFTFLNDKNIDVVINLAGITDVDKCEKYKKKTYFVNVTIPKNLAYACQMKNISFVHISTDHIFNGQKKTRYLETNIPNPINFYAKTKYLAENYIKKILKKYIIVRTNFFSLLEVKSTFLHKIFILSKKKNPPTIKLWDNVYFTPVHTSTIVDIVDLLIEKKLYGVFNISSNEVLSKFNFFSLIKKFFKLDKLILLKTSVNIDNNKSHVVKRPLNMSLNNKKIKTIFPYLNSILSVKNQILMLNNDLKSNKKLSKC
jgi:dTDP-4-dehydrorhamnose reductase